MNADLDITGWFGCLGNDRAFAANFEQPLAALNLLSHSYSRAMGINSARQITGFAEFTNVGIRAFFYEKGSTTIIPPLGTGAIAWGNAISDQGVVVGQSAISESANHAFRWEAGMIADLQLPVGPSNEANDVNTSNQIVGWMGDAGGGGFFAEAFLWDNGNVTPLGIPDGATNSEANAISDNGLICGTYTWTDENGDFIRRAIVWRNGEMIELGTTPGYQRTYGLGINDAGEVVGRSDNAIIAPSVPGGGAFIWCDGVMVRLFHILAPGSGITRITSAADITNSGHIAVSASFGQGDRATLLTPLPPKTGDTNCDWVTNVDDLLNVINSWGPDAEPPAPFSGSPDLDENGSVNVDDLLAVINGWGI